MPWLRFARAEIAGELVWVSIYTGIGFLFAGEIAAALTLLSDALWFLVALAVVAGLGLRVRKVLRSG